MTVQKENVIDWFKLNYKKLHEQMKKCKHKHSNGMENPFHLEDDVWTHTIMVIKEVENEIDLIFAALLHDIGKVKTRKEKETGRVSFFGHESVSTYMAIEILDKAEFSGFQLDKELILKLINYHGRVWNKKGEDQQSKLKELNQRYGDDYEFYKQLLSLARADALGRIVMDKDDREYIKDSFSLLENYIPYNPHQYRKHVPNKKVYILIGPSGSGKSTYIQNNLKNIEIISVDKYIEKGKLDYNSVNYSKNVNKAWRKVLNDMKEAAKRKVDVVIDMTNLSEEDRNKKLKHFPSTVYEYIGIVFMTNIDEIMKRNKVRIGKNIPQNIIEGQIEKFEIPTKKEFDVIKFIF